MLGDSKALIAVCIIFPLLAAISVSLRIWARRLKKLPLALNDHAIIFALVVAVGLAVSVIIAVFLGGNGEHIKSLTPGKVTVLLKVFFVGEILWVVANTAVKVSILDLYITIFRNRPFLVAAYVIMVIVLCYCLSVVLIACLICRPLSYNWDKTINGSCVDESTAFIAVACLNLALDIAIIVLPLKMLWGLHLAIRKKMALIGIFSLGVFICVVTALRIVYLVKLDYSDFSYSGGLFSIWSIVENNLGIVNACLPVMRPLLRKIPDWFPFLWLRNKRFKQIMENKKPCLGTTLTKAPCSSDCHSNRSERSVDQIYPLTNLSGTRNHISALGNEKKSDLGESDFFPAEDPNGMITVTRTWNVHSKPEV